MSRRRVGVQSATNSATLVVEISPLVALLPEFLNGFPK
jgi:hypothetical protein